MKTLVKSILVPACIALISAYGADVKYNLTVHGAELTLHGADGTGTYPQGKEVPLILSNTPEGREFVAWSGGGGYVRDVYSPKTSVLIPARDLCIKARYREKGSCGIADLDQIRQEVRSSATTESNARSRHAALRRWWRLFWRQGYDLSAFDKTSWILLTRGENTPQMIPAIDRDFAILEDLLANPVYIAEVTGAADVVDQDAQSKNRMQRTNWPFYHGAGSMVYCLDAVNGSLLWKHKVSDWIRSKPLVIGDVVYVATLDGHLYALRDGGSQAVELRKVKVNQHGFTTDLTGSEKGILAAGKDIILYSVFPETFYLNWKHGIVDGAWVDGEFYRIKLEGGPPSLTVVDGIVYCGDQG